MKKKIKFFGFVTIEYVRRNQTSRFIDKFTNTELQEF